MSISDSDSLRLRCDAYLALTSNTVQFGARVELHAAGGGFSFDGYLGFDALFQFAPFAFVVDLAAGIALRYHGRLLMGIHFEGRLSGPTPWHIQGKATIKIWFFKVDRGFQAAVWAGCPSAGAGAARCAGARAGGRAGRAQLEWDLAARRPSVGDAAGPGGQWDDALRASAGGGDRAAARGAVESNHRQSRECAGAGRSGSSRCRRSGRHQATGDLPLATTPVHEAFALAQYQEMRDEEKLARPSFETQEAGLRWGARRWRYAYDPVVDERHRL